MSKKRKKDYKKVLQQILKLLPSPPARVAERLVADFEDRLWRAVKTVFPDIHIQGCAFHWGQAFPY
jgi:transposase-like protein